MKASARNHIAAIFGALGLAIACGGKGGYSSSSSSHWVCQMPEDCASIAGAVDCQDGYCVDASGMRLTNDGAGGGMQSDGGSAGNGSGGAAGTLQSGGSAGGQTRFADADCPGFGVPGRDLPIADCSERESEPCVLEPTETYPAFEDTIRSIVSSCAPSNQSSMELEFEDGCAYKLVFSGSPALDPTALYDCVGAGLATTRFACATDIACTTIVFSTLP